METAFFVGMNLLLLITINIISCELPFPYKIQRVVSTLRIYTNLRLFCGVMAHHHLNGHTTCIKTISMDSNKRAVMLTHPHTLSISHFFFGRASPFFVLVHLNLFSFTLHAVLDISL